mgnify:CR=1 FL=1|tara:strand:+ start:338 stop:904 length:567 start_codon:yes stop_codon:yes gene_type:complete
MVSTTGQIDAPLVDIGNVRKEYWQRKEVLMPSLTNFMPEKRHWFGLKKTKQTPKLILRRLNEEEWRSLNERFMDIREEIHRELPLLNKLLTKLSKGQILKEKEMRVVNNSQSLALPIYTGMLEIMIEEPKMNYDEVRVLLDAVDEYDRETLLSYVNALTSEKATIANKVQKERTAELSELRREMRVGA